MIGPTPIASVLSGDRLAELAAALTAAGLPADDITEPDQTFFELSNAEGRPLGFVGYERIGSNALLRSMLVPESWRGQGAGTNILTWILVQLRQTGVQRVYLLTTTAAPFFARHGFHPITRDAVPTVVRATRQFAALCPATATAMMRTL